MDNHLCNISIYRVYAHVFVCAVERVWSASSLLHRTREQCAFAARINCEAKTAGNREGQRQVLYCSVFDVTSLLRYAMRYGARAGTAMFVAPLRWLWY